jgi:hypothetical protein
MKKNTGKFAFAYVLYGGTETFFHLLTSVRTLAATNPYQDRVLLYRDSVPEWQLEILRNYFTRMMRIDPFPVGDTLFADSSEERFYGVFDKLYCWGLDDYERVVLLEADTLVLKRVTHLFYVKTPAAHIPLPDYSWKTDSPIPPGIQLRNSFNCGCLVLEPSIGILNSMVWEIENLERIQKRYTRPDTAFLFSFFSNQWHTLSLKYNFHPRYFSRGEKRLHHNKYLRHVKIRDLSILHCHGSQKPLTALVDSERYQAQNKNERQFINNLHQSLSSHKTLISTETEQARSNKEKFESLMAFWIQCHREAVAQHREQIGEYKDDLSQVA